MTNKTVTIEKCEGGYVMQWSRPYVPPHSNVFPAHSPLEPTNGTEVHTTLKEVLASAKLHLS
ncbi:hypothetical protein LCGC14_2982250 [marine sediment metagenome]|uniref:Uncharacterized protein n=1 Tax=marine sediment metagenome TaxID=412755 RepID=A0A0F8ZXH5_9ZZZZ